MYDCTCLCVFRRREGPGKLTPGMLFGVGSLRSNVSFTDDFSVLAKIVQMKLWFTRFWTGCCQDMMPV